MPEVLGGMESAPEDRSVQGKFRAIFPDVFRHAVKTANYPISNFETTFDLVNILTGIQDGRKP